MCDHYLCNTGSPLPHTHPLLPLLSGGSHTAGALFFPGFLCLGLLGFQELILSGDDGSDSYKKLAAPQTSALHRTLKVCT